MIHIWTHLIYNFRTIKKRFLRHLSETSTHGYLLSRRRGSNSDFSEISAARKHWSQTCKLSTRNVHFWAQVFSLITLPLTKAAERDSQIGKDSENRWVEDTQRSADGRIQVNNIHLCVCRGLLHRLEAHSGVAQTMLSKTQHNSETKLSPCEAQHWFCLFFFPPFQHHPSFVYTHLLA